MTESVCPDGQQHSWTQWPDRGTLCRHCGDRRNTPRSGHFWFRMGGLLVTLAMAWASYALDRSMFWALMGASSFAIGILLGEES